LPNKASPAEAPLVVVAGPTASGKSRIAIAVAEAFDGVVINADSMQVYRELRVLTARPTPEDEARVPHRLFGCVQASERCSAGRWRRLAMVEIAAARADGRRPVIVGGTGLYLQALTAGIAPVPEVPDHIRAEALALYERLGGDAFRDELAAVDPAAAARLPASDRQRLMRAWEVVRATGRTLSEWQERQTPGVTAEIGGPTLAVVLLPPREQLYRTIDARFDAMLAAGAIDEVRRLLALGLDPTLPAMKAFGVREIAAYLAGSMTLEAAATAAKQGSRQYAKRQMTWLRHHKISERSFVTQFPEKNLDEILSFIRQGGLTGLG
jgi:tRNA dimethylallyltransferase